MPQEPIDASAAFYTPANFANWSPPPEFINEALDQLAADKLNASRFATVIEQLPIGSFLALTGTPVYGQVGTNLAAWALDDTVDEEIVGQVVVPPLYSSGGLIRLYWAMASATTNDVVVQADVLSAAAGEDADAAGTAASDTVTVPGTAGLIAVTDLTPAVTYAAGDLLRVALGRLGSDGNDTATGDLWLLASAFVYNVP